MLEKVRYVDYYNGINVEALTDGYAFDDYSCIHLLSVGGHDSSVKAITSALVSVRTIEILSGSPVEVNPAFGQKYRILSTKIPSGLLHQIVAAESLFRFKDDGDRLLLVNENGNHVKEVYEAVRNGYPVPLIPEWSDWLYRNLIEDGYITELYGTRKVLKLNLDEEVLDSMISEGVRNGEITF